MPNLAANHPQVIHFAIALLFVGVAFRVVSLVGRPKWMSPAAAALLLLGAAAAWVAVKSGIDAHGPVERIPGLREVVEHHEQHGKETRNIFLGVAGIELLALGVVLLSLGHATRYLKALHALSALVGCFGLTVLYETSEIGGELVYSYAGGPGLRTGEAVDVERLLRAGLYQQALADRRAGRAVDAARLIGELAARSPQDTTIRFLQAESLLLDAQDHAGALAGARAVGVDPSNERLRARQASLVADAFLAMGMTDSAAATLTEITRAFPRQVRLKAKLDSIK